MNRLCTAVNDMRLNRKRFSISGSLLPLLLLLVLLVVQTSARPSSVNGTIKNNKPSSDTNAGGDVDDGIADVAFDAGDDYTGVDNVEWHHVKIVDGIMHEDHPIIMYKEDFVSEDYDPSQHKVNSNSAESNSHARRRYKHLQRQRLNRTEQTEKYHALKPEKIYFDILPPTPVVVTDDSSTNDSKFDTANIRVEVISLLDDEEARNKAQSSSIINDDNDESNNKNNKDEELPSKEMLNKRPKKYHHRMRRDTTGNAYREHMVHKRHPHYNYERVGSNSFDDYTNHLLNNWGPKHSVAGNKWNGIDGEVPPAIDFGKRFGGEDNTDRVVWGSSRTNRRPTTTKTTRIPQFPPLLHNSNPEDADFSVFSTRRPTQNSNSQPTTQRPQMPQFPPLIHDSNPENADFSVFTTRRPTQNSNSQPTTQRPQMPQFPPLLHDSNPENADFSVFTRPPSRVPATTQRPTTRPTTRPPASSNAVSTGETKAISNCVWAIVSCCSTRDTKIRYACFELLGCRGAFWDLNPCADNVKDSVLDYIDQQMQ